ncbi:hypothetical protein NDU88_006031 [Pleurodeles waltl]|uniref:Receptor ligand binding region domain-containing protein n=1 Tax=Pleurodeles waltl TaxID=8319 RepID=A0AAV7TD01_PLEWA|nr:hypothetical protein NDU88_006031 [Pleurodeles waltl]
MEALFRVRGIIQGILLLSGGIIFPEATEPMCYMSKQMTEAFSRGGNVVLGGIFVIHSKVLHQESDFTETPKPSSCQGFHTRYFRDVLAMVFTLEMINKDPDLLPNLTLGFEIFDSCVSESRAIQGALGLLSGKRGLSCRLGSPVVGVVGDSMSSLSIPVARILGLYHFPQISFGSLEPVLADRHQFPSFLRTVPSEKIQDVALSHLLRLLHLTWVGILARDDDLGEMAGQHLKEQIISSGGCVAFLEKVHFRYSTEKIRRIKEVIRNSTAIAIVVYCEEMHLKPVLEAMSVHGSGGKIWILSLSFIFTSELFSEEAWQLINGSIGLVLHRGEMPGFDYFIRSLNASNYAQDSIVQAFWEEVFKCQWASNASLLNQHHICTGQEELGPLAAKLFELEDLSYTFQTYLAVYSFAHALHNLVTSRNLNELLVPGFGVPDLHDIRPWQVGAQRTGLYEP